jgi:DNA-binding CsgD family transcriptional regulator
MTVVPTSDFGTSVLVVSPDPAVRNAIARLLSFDQRLNVLGNVASIAAASSAEVVVDETILEDLKAVTVGDFIAMVRELAAPVVPATRHLRPIEGRGDMRDLLSDRELQVVKLVAEGLSNKQISLRLELSDKTVKNHLSHILAKLGLSARTQVAVHALRAGLV